MKLQTPVETGKSKVSLSIEDKIMVLGSCFADNVGQKMADIGMDVLVNPFGTLYNPQSIANSISRMRTRCPFTREEIRKMGSGSEAFCSFSHHTSFARATEDAFLENANVALLEAADFYQECTKVIITLGTSWCYRHIEDGIIVSNCLKRDAKEFRRERMDVQDIVRELSAVMLPADGETKKEFLFTVSPIRHLKDGAHGNQISKSTLLLAVDELCGKFSGCDYFPAYEIVMDELRDYRFYAEDMTHPSQQTVNYIWERFCEAAVPESEMPALKEKEKAWKRSLHRPNVLL